VELEILDPAGLVPAAVLDRLNGLAAAAMAHLGGEGEVRVRVVADAEMAMAHERYSAVPGTTDVLTFDLSEGSSAAGAPLDVDILICVDEARRQAAARGVALEHELLLYTVHGVLHCLGEDDHDPEEARRMHEREDRVLGAIGVGPVYAAPERGEGRA
jgi:probable rRNA maturation factor